MSSPALLKPGLKWVAKKVFPRQFWQYKFDSYKTATGEGELRLVPWLCDRNKTSVDVGASTGLYSVNMLPVSRDVIAFEPRPRQCADLQAMFTSVGLPVRVENVALSNQESTLVMRVLEDDPGRSTIESENQLEDEGASSLSRIEVNVRRLDDFRLDDVGFIKIDVEGHEVAVLQGAKETIAKARPSLLIEAEDRHRKNAVADVNHFLEELGYAGFFLLEGRLHDIAEFSVSEHQNSDNVGGWQSGWARHGIYVNNFLFVPQGRSDRLVEAVRDLSVNPTQL